MARLRPRLTYANIISTICLFMLLGGTATAALVITGKNVKNGSLTVPTSRMARSGPRMSATGASRQGLQGRAAARWTGRPQG
jgi:hypothetical protein